MWPHVCNLSTYFLLWAVAATLGIAVGLRLTTRAGFPRRQSLLALSAFALTILIGSKLLYVVEHLLFPFDEPVPLGASHSALFGQGFRIPGGILLLAPAFPAVCRWLRLPVLRFADAAIPAAGVALFWIRIGCFLNGCCFGGVTALPIGMTFPPGTRVFEWQVSDGLIGMLDPHSLPVHPLQLYFALLGLVLFVFAVRWQHTKHFDGEVWANFFMVFFGATFFLEFLRPQPLHLNLIMTASVVFAASAIWLRAHRQSLAVAGEAY